MRRRFLPTASSKLSDHILLVERIVAEREEDDVVVGMQPGVGNRVCGSVGACGTGEQVQHHVFVLKTDPGASEITFVNILPEANRNFADALNVGRAHGAVGVEM